MSLHTLMREDRGYVNPREYGSALTQATLQGALTAIGSTPATLLLTPGTWAIGAPLTIPAHVTLSRARGAVLSISTGVTLTINGDQDGPMAQWLTLVGTGTVVFGPRIPELSAEWFGASADGTTDCTAALNLAARLAATQTKALRLLAGTYKITDTWWITPPGSLFLTAHVTGAGRGYAPGISQTAIDATDPAMRTKPALVIQKARALYLGHLCITGPNLAPANLAVGNMRYTATWVTTGVRDQRYSPQCGLAIDAGVGNPPPDGGYPGLTYTGAGGGSSDTVLDNLLIRDCVVGVMASPDAQPASQGDTITLRESSLLGVKVGVAIGQSQVRGFSILGGNIGIMRTAIDCGEYGQQQGASVQVHGTQFGPGFEVASVSPGFGPSIFVGIRTESLHRLGQAGRGWSTTGYPTTFVACDLHIGSDEIPAAPVLWDSPAAGLVFLGGSIDSDANPKPAALLPYAYPAVFRGTQFSLRNCFRPYLGSPQDFIAPLTLEDCRLLDASTVEFYGMTGRGLMGARISAHWGLTQLVTAAGVYRYLPGTTQQYRQAVTASGHTWTATTLTFSLTDASYLLVGDFLIWLFLPLGSSLVQQRGVALEVTQKTGTGPWTITCALLYPRSYYDETSPPNYVQILVHEWAPGQALTGNLTSGNPVISSVSPTTILQNGDWLKGASGIPADARVVSGGGTASVTMNKPATAPATGVALFWGRLHTLNTTVAF